jgi:methionine synthase / methylenetetrahydrofolate reductase(NADPH)
MVTSDVGFGCELLIGSGAVGTFLRARHGAAGPVEALNLTQPEWIGAMHRAYRDAGARILTTNTFAANKLALEEVGLAERCGDINGMGVSLARQAAGEGGMVWASVGPLDLGLRHDDFDDGALRGIYLQQCRALSEADLLMLETFTNLREARLATEAAAEIGLPFILQTGNLGGGNGQWRKIDQFIALAESAGAAAVGTNCRYPDDIAWVCQYLLARTSLPVTAAPNAGQPIIVRGAVRYDFSPGDMHAIAQRLLGMGVCVVGGCCGTTPDHIRAIAGLGGRKVRDRSVAVVVQRENAIETAIREPRRNRIRELIANTDVLISVEIRAARNEALEDILQGAAHIAGAGPDLFDVPDNPGASIGRDAMVTAVRLQQESSLASICHMTVTQSNLLRIHSSLIGCGDLGLEGVLAVTGDPPGMGGLAHSAGRVKDLRSSVELLRLIRSLREGRSTAGQAVADAPDLCAGCAVRDAGDAQIEWLRKKLDAGAEYVFSQPVFTYDDCERLAEAVAPLNIRLLVGILPLASKRNAEFLAGGRIPGIKVPLALVKAFDRYGDEDSQRRFGLDCAYELAAGIARATRGLYVIMPFGKTCYLETADLVRYVRKSLATNNQRE